MSETITDRRGAALSEGAESTWDVVVVGAGGAGLAAAVTAAEAGASVLVLEAEPQIGGSTKKSAGMLTASQTPIQAALGVEDDPERMYQHYMDLNQWKVLPGPVWEFCRRSGEMVEWLLGLGLPIPSSFSRNAHEPGLARAGVEDVWRGHVPEGKGKGLVEVLDRRRRELDIPVETGQRVTELVIEDGRVHGVRIGDRQVHARSVVVASGGYARNPELVARYLPDALAAGDSQFVVAAEGSRGDHITFATHSNLALFGEGWGLLLLTARFQRFHHWESGFPPHSRIHVDHTGRRCMDEDAPYAVSQGIWKERGGCVWAIFDEQARTGLPSGKYEDWDPARILEEVEKGVVTRADSLEELARLIRVPAETLRTSVDRWNTQLPQGKDDDFRRHETLRAKGVDHPLEPIAAGPFYAVQMVPGELVCTHTGLRIDSTANVTTTTGAAVHGLYAAGEAAGGVLGQRYVGGGNSVTNGMVLGRMAGANAAAHARTVVPVGAEL